MVPIREKNEEVLARVKRAFLEDREVQFGTKRYRCIDSVNVNEMLTEVRRDIHYSRATVCIKADDKFGLVIGRASEDDES